MRKITISGLLLVVLLATTAHAQYCQLYGRVPYSDLQPGITNFKLNTINRTSSNVESMDAVLVTTNDSTTLYRGRTYTVTIAHNRDSVFFPTSRNNVRVWIDYNNNKSFTDTGETVISADYKAYGTFTASFTVPVTAPLGKVRLRATAKMSSDAGHTIPTSCDSPAADPIGYHGELEDYWVKIAAPVAVEDVAAGSLSTEVFPNPTDGKVSVVLNGLNNETVSIELFDAAGRLQATLKHQGNTTAPQVDVDLNAFGLPPGIYYLKITSPGTTLFHKVSKVN